MEKKMKLKVKMTFLFLFTTTFTLNACTISASKIQFVTMTPTLLSSVEQTYLEQTTTQIANPNATSVPQSNSSEYDPYTGNDEEVATVPVFPTLTPIINTNTNPTSTPLNFSPTQTPITTIDPINTQTTISSSPTPNVVTQPITHVVAYGESIWCLARRYNVDPTALMNANGLNSQSWLTIDQNLTIPSNVDPFPGTRTLSVHPTTYAVNYGDSLASIACLFGDLYPSEIANANAQSNTWQPTAGEVIQIP
jgi:LysM repeat protein